MIVPIKIYPLRHRFSFHPSLSFYMRKSQKEVDSGVALSAYYVTQTDACAHMT